MFSDNRLGYLAIVENAVVLSHMRWRGDMGSLEEFADDWTIYAVFGGYSLRGA